MVCRRLQCPGDSGNELDSFAPFLLEIWELGEKPQKRKATTLAPTPTAELPGKGAQKQRKIYIEEDEILIKTELNF